MPENELGPKFSPEAAKPQDECSVVGVYSRTRDIPSNVYTGLVELNHRGQESSGILLSNGHDFVLTKDSGLASIVFRLKNDLPKLPGAFIGIGHDRYSTSGSSSELQPFIQDGIAIVHNGNLTNAEQLRKKYDIPEEIDGARSDTRVALAVISKMPGDEQAKIIAGLKEFEGAYNFVFATKDAMYASRDPLGFRPLSLGKLDNDSFVVASETSAFTNMGVEFIRDVMPGETVMINDDGIKTISQETKTNLAQCVFELVYISRPDSVVFGIPVMEFRLREGEILARHMPDADIIMPVPRSGIGAALGVAASEAAKNKGISYMEGLYTNPYRNVVKGLRTFLRAEERAKAADNKYSPTEFIVRDKRVILVDDSIVRGSLSIVVEKLRLAGAAEIHALIASPPISHGCYMGVDFGDGELLANKFPDPEERRKELGLDSLTHLSYSELLEAAFGREPEAEVEEAQLFEKNGFCGACFTGRYPLSVEGAIGKETLIYSK